jgi:hypothetical protein
MVKKAMKIKRVKHVGCAHLSEEAGGDWIYLTGLHELDIKPYSKTGILNPTPTMAGLAGKCPASPAL